MADDDLSWNPVFRFLSDIWHHHVHYVYLPFPLSCYHPFVFASSPVSQLASISRFPDRWARTVSFFSFSPFGLFTWVPCPFTHSFVANHMWASLFCFGYWSTLISIEFSCLCARCIPCSTRLIYINLHILVHRTTHSSHHGFLMQTASRTIHRPWLVVPPTSPFTVNMLYVIRTASILTASILAASVLVLQQSSLQQLVGQGKWHDMNCAVRVLPILLCRCIWSTICFWLAWRGVWVRCVNSSLNSSSWKPLPDGSSRSGGILSRDWRWHFSTQTLYKDSQITETYIWASP